MKILGISFSPRKGQNTETMLQKALEGAKQEGADTELFTVAGKEIKPCDGCSSCGETGKCHIKDDMQELYQKMIDADGMIFGTPVYFFDVPAQGKAVIDRTFALQPIGSPLNSKAGGILIAAGSTGAMDVVKNLYSFFGAHRIFPVNWVTVYSPVVEKKKGMEACFSLGREMVSFLDGNPQFPRDFAPNHISFGTHTH